MSADGAPRRQQGQPGALLALVLLATAVAMASAAAAADDPDKVPDKVGAGLLLCSSGKVLLLKRRSKHNDNTWTVPGGNIEPGEGSLLGAATREAMEELGVVPPFEVKAQILTKRGKKDQKHFTIFVAEVDATSAAQLKPTLSNESREWRWVPWADVLAAAAAGGGSKAALQLHPVVALLATTHAGQVRAATQACAAKAGH